MKIHFWAMFMEYDIYTIQMWLNVKLKVYLKNRKTNVFWEAFYQTNPTERLYDSFLYVTMSIKIWVENQSKAPMLILRNHLFATSQSKIWVVRFKPFVKKGSPPVLSAL